MDLPKIPLKNLACGFSTCTRCECTNAPDGPPENWLVCFKSIDRDETAVFAVIEEVLCIECAIGAGFLDRQFYVNDAKAHIEPSMAYYAAGDRVNFYGAEVKTDEEEETNANGGGGAHPPAVS